MAAGLHAPGPAGGAYALPQLLPDHIGGLLLRGTGGRGGKRKKTEREGNSSPKLKVIRISTAINDDNSYLHTSDSENILALFHFSRIGMLLFTVATAQHNTADIPPRFKMLEAFVPSWATRIHYLTPNLAWRVDP